MAAGTNPIFGQTPKTQGTIIAPADTTVPKAIYTAGANGAIILGINAVTTDTAPNDVNLYVLVGGTGTAQNIGGKRVPALAGMVAASTTPSTQLLDRTQIPSLLPDGTLQLGAGDVLQAGCVATVTTAKALTVLVQALDY